MPSLRSLARTAAAATLIPLLSTQPAWAWGRDGHLMINRLAVQNLPGDVPKFLRDKNAVQVIEYLGPEPDRWRGRSEEELSSTQAPDHFLDEEWADLAGAPCETASPGCSTTGAMLPRKRYDYVRALDAAQQAHPELHLQPDKVGMLPWQVEEVWQRLKSDLRDYRKLSAEHANTAGVQDLILFEAGWLGHYVADASQPLHTTIHFNGWNSPENPNGYTTEHTIHAQFESTYVSANLRDTDVRPLVAATQPVAIADEWTQFLDFLHHSHAQVERVYQLEKTGGFTGAGTPEARAFTSERLAAATVELRDLIYSAWVHSADPVPEYKGPQ